MTEEYKLELPAEAKDNRVLMHSCCAPCAGDLMERMKVSGIDVTIFFYNPNIHTDIDDLAQKINISQNFMQYLIKELEKHIDDKKNEKSLITLKYNDRDGYHLLLTNRRCEMLKTKLNKMKTINVNGFELDVKDLEFNELPKSSNTKINCKKVKQLSLELVNYKISLARKLKETFKIDMIDFLSEFGEVLHLWSKKIAYIDFINSGALCAINNHYTKPIIKNSNDRFLKCF
jgi:DNA mismatch repair ATPase MutS